MIPLVEFHDVDFAYAGAAPGGPGRFALVSLSFTVERGEVFGVIGPNSAGKTSLLRLLTRVLTPSRGDIRLDGRPVATLPRAALARAIAVVPQEVPRPFPYSVEQLVLMGRYPHAPGRFFESAEDHAIALEAMRATDTLALRAMPLDDLSGGERQRALVARALAQRPRLLVLDEPTAHLDLRHQVEIAALLRRLNAECGLTILVVSHDLNLAGELCDRLLLLAAGRVVKVGGPAEILDAAMLATVFGCAVTVDKGVLTGRPSVRVVWPPDGSPAP